MAGVVRVTADGVTDITEETLSSSTSRFSNLTALHVAAGRAVFSAYDRFLDNRTVAVKCRVCSRDRSDRFYFLHLLYAMLFITTPKCVVMVGLLGYFFMSSVCLSVCPVLLQF